KALLENVTHSQAENSRIHDLRHAPKLRNGLSIDIDRSRCGVDTRYRVRIENVEQVEHAADRLTLRDLELLLDPDVCQFPCWIVVCSLGFHIDTAECALR